LVEIRENIKPIPFDVFHDENGQIVIRSPVFAEDTPEKRKYLIEVQNRLRRFLERILKAKENSKNVRVTDNKIFKKRGKMILDNKECTYGQGPLFKKILEENRKVSVMIGDGGILVDMMPGEHALEFELADLLYETLPPQKNGIYASLDNIKRCQFPKCHKFFLQVHKKEKKYCSNKCAWRAYSKKRRDKGKI
jgi:hypothetical protein